MERNERIWYKKKKIYKQGKPGKTNKRSIPKVRAHTFVRYRHRPSPWSFATRRVVPLPLTFVIIKVSRKHLWRKWDYSLDFKLQWVAEGVVEWGKQKKAKWIALRMGWSSGKQKAPQWCWDPKHILGWAIADVWNRYYEGIEDARRGGQRTQSCTSPLERWYRFIASFVGSHGIWLELIGSDRKWPRKWPQVRNPVRKLCANRNFRG